MELVAPLGAPEHIKNPLAPEKQDTWGRRRPGRSKDIDPGLIPLLRSQPADCYTEDKEDADDPLGAAKGIMLAVTIMVLFWAMGVMVAVR